MILHERFYWTIGLIVVASALVLVACGGGAEPAVEPETGPPAEEAPPPPPEAPAEEAPSQGDVPAEPPSGEAPAESPVEEAAPGDCIETDPHPIGQSIAETYETVSYEQVINWFCDGNTFDDILLALETNAQTGTSTEDLLAMRAAGAEWDQIWQDIGFVE